MTVRTNWRIHGFTTPLPAGRHSHRRNEPGRAGTALRAEERCAPLPPSIVSLKSMKDLAHPDHD